VGDCTLDRYEDTSHVDREHPIEVLQRKRFGQAGRAHSGVVHEDVQATQGGRCLVDRIAHLLCVGAVGSDRHR
jgi:hypothetical protein